MNIERRERERGKGRNQGNQLLGGTMVLHVMSNQLNFFFFKGKWMEMRVNKILLLLVKSVNVMEIIEG